MPVLLPAGVLVIICIARKKSRYPGVSVVLACTLFVGGCLHDKASEQDKDTPPNDPPATTTQYTLSVSVTGSGSVSSASGIDCGADCSEVLDSGTVVTLTATPASGYNFTGWSGACSGIGTTCALTMSADQNAVATFTAITTPPPPPPPVTQFGLTVTITGTGSVSSSPVGIACPGDCTQNYDDGGGVTLTAVPGANQQFSGWANACGGMSTTCTLNMNQNRTAVAQFTPIQHTLTVSVTGTGSVTSNPTGIDCGSDCTQVYDHGTSVTLTATPGASQRFAGWSGACSGTSPCIVSLTQARAVTASFVPEGIVDANCDGPWSGSEETTTITAWPYRDCFRTNPVGTRTRMTNNVGAEVVWEQGTGWNGKNALRVRPPDGSTGQSGQAGQGYAGLGEHHFHAVRTKRLNIRYLVRYNANWAAHAQRNKWEVAIKYDYANPAAPERRTGCERGIVEGRLDPMNNARENAAPRQGVCTDLALAPNLNGWYWGPGVRENEWIAVENEFDLETGWYRTYITTQDGVLNQSVHSEINITTGTSGAPAEAVPNPYWWGSIDCTAGCYWDSPSDQGSVPRPVDTYIWYSHVVISDRYIGPPPGFRQ